MAASLDQQVVEIREFLQDFGDPAAAKRVKSPWHVAGVPLKQLDVIGRRLGRRHLRDSDLTASLTIARRLWRSASHEEKLVAIRMMAVLGRRLKGEQWKTFKGWLRRARCEVLRDEVATDLLGKLVMLDRAWCRVLRHWTRSKDAWERRAAVYSVMGRVRLMGDVEAGLSICEPLLRDRARSVREAVAAVLKEAKSLDLGKTRELLGRHGGFSV